MANYLELIICDYGEDKLSIIIDKKQTESEDSFNINSVEITREDWHKIVSFVNDNF